MKKILQEHTHGNLHPYLFQIFQKYVQELNIPIKDIAILDVGSGSGAWGKRLLDNGYENIHLIDGYVDPDIEFKHFTRSNFTEAMPYENDTYDIISCFEVIEHVENQYQLINEMLRCVKKGGYIILTSPNINNLIGKFLFFLTGNLFAFFEKDGYFTTFPNHINPFYLPCILAYYRFKIKLIKTFYSVGKLPFTGGKVAIPFKNRYIGNTAIYVFQKPY